MDVALEAVLAPRMKFYHEYDYGSTTDLALRTVAGWEGETGRSAVMPLARNVPPEIFCGVCGKPKRATRICTECRWNAEGWMCGDCAVKHKCGQQMLLPVVNSPRRNSPRISVGAAATTIDPRKNFPLNHPLD